VIAPEHQQNDRGSMNTEIGAFTFACGPIR